MGEGEGKGEGNFASNLVHGSAYPRFFNPIFPANNDQSLIPWQQKLMFWKKGCPFHGQGVALLI